MSHFVVDYFITETCVAIKFKDCDIVIDLDKLRKACPCANCGGEKDVFGNVYKPKEKALNNISSQLHHIKLVGSYALRFFWKDGHSDGIYTFKFLKGLNE